MKAKRTCLGYKDEFELNLRRHDSSATSIRAVQTRKPGADILSVVKSLPQTPRYQDPAFSIQLKIPWIPQALEWFIGDFVLRSNDRAISRGYFNNLVSLLNYVGPHSLFAESTEAVALVCLAKKPGAGALALNAAEKYGDCLAQLRHALTDPAQQNSIKTLFSILMMALYEVSPKDSNVLVSPKLT